MQCRHYGGQRGRAPPIMNKCFLLILEFLKANFDLTINHNKSTKDCEVYTSDLRQLLPRFHVHFLSISHNLVYLLGYLSVLVKTKLQKLGHI